MCRILVFLLLIKEFFCENCVCVPFWKCNDDNLESDEDFNLLGLRSGCDGYFDICCKIKCGQRKTENLVFSEMIRDRITGSDNEANFAEFPWMLGILKANTYHCGASLIHPNVALTAAHCLETSDTYKIRAGEWDWRNRKEPLKHQDRLVKKIIIHPRYNPNSLINDIALIILERPFKLSDNVGIICLPQQNSVPFSEECVVTGWGKTSHKSFKHQAILNKAGFPIVSNDLCEASLQRALLGPSFRLHRSFLCAGGKHIDTCKGDGGSPLICGIRGEDDRYEQFGVVSWGLLCGLHNAPGVYVSVSHFINWIDEQMVKHGFDTQIYKYEK